MYQKGLGVIGNLIGRCEKMHEQFDIEKLFQGGKVKIINQIFRE